MNKHEIFRAFDQKISPKSIVQRNDEYVVQGKFCVVAPLGNNEFDIWICNPDDLYNGLGQRKVRNIAAKLFKSAVGTMFTELTGEGYGVVAGAEIILQNLELLGIKKKRVVSPENLEKLKTRMRELRRKQNMEEAA